MPRRQRIHVPEATYYIVRRTNSQRPIFTQPHDYALIASLLPSALKRADARLLGYCWMPDAIHLALQIGEAPVGDFMRQLTSRYALQLHRRAGECGQLFRRPYQSTLVDLDTYLPRMIQYLHYIPVLAGLASHPDGYPYTSHQIYLGKEHVGGVYCGALLRILDSFDEERVAYRRLMADPPPAPIAKLLERGSPSTPGILGDASFISRLPRRGRVIRSRMSLDEIAAHVALSHDMPRSQLMSRSRRRDLVLARAQFAWYATERRIASLHEVARYLGHSASCLTRAISRYQRQQPEMFTFSAFSNLVPIGRPRQHEIGTPRWEDEDSEHREDDDPAAGLMQTLGMDSRSSTGVSS